MERIFLDWGRPALHLLLDYLRREIVSGNVWDLSRTLVVLPTARSVNRLNELVSNFAAEKRLLLRPPDLVTIGDLPELLYQPQRQFAGENAQTFAWVRALESLSSDELLMLTPQPPLLSQLEAWLDLGEVLKRLHRELSSQSLDFHDVLKRLSTPEEQDRWRVLERLQQRYHAELDAVELWDKQTARRVAIERGEPKISREVLVSFCVDLNETQRAMLLAVGDRVRVLIAAPALLKDRFDELGCLRYGVWRDADLDVHESHLRIASGPADQAAAVAELICDLGDRASCDEVAICAADAPLVASVDEYLQQLGLSLAFAAGMPVAHTAPALLMSALADCLDRDGFSDWACLARHPHLAAIVGEVTEDGSDWLLHFDQFASEHLPVRLDLNELEAFEIGAMRLDSSSSGGRLPQYLHPLKQWKEKVDRWLAPLRGPPRWLSAWRKPILEILQTVYSQIVHETQAKACTPTLGLSHGDEVLWQACRAMLTAIERATDVPPALDRKVSAAHALRAALEATRNQSVRPIVSEYAIDGIGWLDAPLDDHPHLIVTGLADGIVPQMIASDPFLPMVLRKHLNLEDNERRHGRDAYAMQLTLNSGRSVRFVVGRVNNEGQPLSPSRLLLARPSREVPARVLRLFDPKANQMIRRMVLPHQFSASRLAIKSDGPLQRPKPIPGLTTDRMSVTSFGDYLRCPYRFYLRHVLRLRPLDDSMNELDPRQLGNLMHDTMEAFGRDPAVSGSIDSEVIRGFLWSELDRLVSCRYGQLPNAAVAFQVEQTRRRLAAAAVKQAEWAATGWQIWKVELPIDRGMATVPNTDMPLIGRIDRIDFHPKLGRCAVLDYKTGAKGKGPKPAHIQAGKWKSLQLPLYRHMVSEIDPERVDVGYFLLPPRESDAGITMADFSATELASADREAKRIAEAVRAGLFWPPTEPYDGIDDFAVICQSHAQVRPSDHLQEVK